MKAFGAGSTRGFQLGVRVLLRNLSVVSILTAPAQLFNHFNIRYLSEHGAHTGHWAPLYTSGGNLPYS